MKNNVLRSLLIGLFFVVILSGCNPTTTTQNNDHTNGTKNNDDPKKLLFHQPEINHPVIKMDDEQNGWMNNVSVDQGVSQFTIFNTMDGGKSWKKKMPEDLSYVSDFTYLNGNTSWLLKKAKDHIVVYQTKDKGQTWKKGNPLQYSQTKNVSGNIASFQFINESIGWITIEFKQGMSDNFRDLYQSTNGGMDWKRIASYQEKTFPTNGLQASPVFADANVGFLPLYNTSTPQLFQSQDGGGRWKLTKLDVKKAPSKTSYFLNSPQFINDQNGVMALYSHTSKGDYTIYILTTQDQGKHWSRHQAITVKPADFHDLVTDFVDLHHGWMTIGDNKIYKNTDPTLNKWIVIANVNEITGIKEANQKIVQFDFVNNSVGWVLVYSNIKKEYALYQTSDGGKQWFQVKSMLNEVPSY